MAEPPQRFRKRTDFSKRSRAENDLRGGGELEAHITSPRRQERDW